eukprot:2135605-Pyramimonas_sp.AAC.1
MYDDGVSRIRREHKKNAIEPNLEPMRHQKNISQELHPNVPVVNHEAPTAAHTRRQGAVYREAERAEH